MVAVCEIESFEYGRLIGRVVAAVQGDARAGKGVGYPLGVEPAADVRRVAMYSKRNLKRINNPRDVMSMPYSLMARRNRYNIYAGNY